MKCLLQMKHAHSITSLLLKLFLVSSSQIFCASWAQAQSSSLSEQGAAPEDSLSASPPWQQLLSDLSSSEDFEHVAWQDYEEDLEEMAQHPVNLNTATREELERMPFLTASQVEDILFYIYRYGQLKSMSELTLISSIGWYQRQLMSCFFYVADDGSKPAFPSLKTIAQHGKHEVMGMLKVPFYERKGDASGTDGYLGYPYKHGLRYQFRYGNSVKLGFVASQDAGEPFFGGRNTMGYDFYSFYLQVKNLGRWKNITLGRYRLNAGLGLILNNDFGFGKLSALTSLGRSSSCIIRGHSSRSSANYLQGAAATYTLLKGLELTGFLSYRQIDATLSADGGGIKTILKTGLHRTVNEIAKQKVASNTLVGGNIRAGTSEVQPFIPLFPFRSRPIKASFTSVLLQRGMPFGMPASAMVISPIASPSPARRQLAIAVPLPRSMQPPISVPTISRSWLFTGSILPVTILSSATAFPRGAMCRMKTAYIWALPGFLPIIGASQPTAISPISPGLSIRPGRALRVGIIW